MALRVMAVWSAAAVLAASVPALGASTKTTTGLAHPQLWPKAHSRGLVGDKTEADITRLLAAMTLEEKVGQMIQADISTIKPSDLRRYPLGSILAGGDSAPLNGVDRSPSVEWLKTARAFRAVSLERRAGHVQIPIIFGVDAVHGNNNVVGATLFPHNVGLGAMRDPQLIGQIGRATAEEAAASGIDWSFGPTLAVPRDERWGRAYEGYAEDPAIVAAYAGKMVQGLQGPPSQWPSLPAGRIAASAKHFLGDGQTEGGKDQGDDNISERALIRLNARPYAVAIDAGVMTIMSSFSSWQGVKMAVNHSLLTDVLKGRMGFQGFVVDDWNAHGQAPGCTNESCAAAINAGVDMVMAPDSWKGFYASLLSQAKSGEVPMARIDDAVRRILRVKLKSGLFGPRPWEGRPGVVGSASHRAIARQAVRESLVLLKNNDAVLPLKSSAHILVAGDGADSVAKQAGGWTLSWQGTGNAPADFPGATSIYAGVKSAMERGGGSAELSRDGAFTRKPDVAIVVFGEDPYAEFQGDRATLDYQTGDRRDLALLRRLKAQGIPVVSVFLSGRPLWVNPEINASDAFVAAWLPGSEGEGVADVLVGDRQGRARHDFKGKLGFSWPRTAVQGPLHHDDPSYEPQFPFGYGLSYRHADRLGPLSEGSGVTGAAANPDVYFAQGRIAAPWRLVLREGAAEVQAAADPAATSGGALSIRPVDADGVQEAGRSLVWTGTAPAAVRIAGPPVDLSRQANGDMALQVRYRVDAPPNARVGLSVGAEAPGSEGLDLTPVLRGAPLGAWTTVRIKLSCFRALGADFAHIANPVIISTRGRLGLSVSELRLVANQGDSICPPP